MLERDLGASIAAVGPLLPLLIWSGWTIYGQKREDICAETGLVPRVLVLHSLAEACSALWPLHPKRALELAESGAP